jgi:hypothetical protein
MYSPLLYVIAHINFDAMKMLVTAIIISAQRRERERDYFLWFLNKHSVQKDANNNKVDILYTKCLYSVIVNTESCVN